jgi:hypothetical protein
MWNDISREEHALWRQLCKTLLEMKVVTEQDLIKPRGDETTPGSALITLIIKWGKANVKLHNNSDLE